MAALAIIFALSGLASLVGAASAGSSRALAASLVELAASGLCALAWGIVP